MALSEAAKPVDAATPPSNKPDKKTEEKTSEPDMIREGLASRLAGATKEQLDHVFERVMQSLSGVPGIASMMAKAGQKKKLFETRFSTKMAEYRKKHPDEENVVLRLKGTGPLVNQYNSQLMNLVGVGDHEGIPFTIARNLEREHPQDFQIVG